MPRQRTTGSGGVDENEGDPLVDGIVAFLVEHMGSLDARMSGCGSDEGKVIRENELKFIDVNDRMVEERILL